MGENKYNSKLPNIYVVCLIRNLEEYESIREIINARYLCCDEKL